VTIEQEKPKSFVSTWVEAETKAHPACAIVKAIAGFTKADEINEAKLLSALKTLAKQGPGEGA
jgi:hypothetical protein